MVILLVLQVVLILPHLVTSSYFRHLSANLEEPSPPFSPPILHTGLIGDGAPQMFPNLGNPYSYGSIYGSVRSDRLANDYGTFSGRGYGPMGAYNGMGTVPGNEQRDATSGFPWGGTAWNYSSPWGDAAHPGPHPMWPIPPSPYGLKENDPRNVGLTSWNQSGVMVSNFTRYGLAGATAFSPHRRYQYPLGNIPSSWAWKYAGAPGGEPIPFRHQGIIPSIVPEGMERGSSVQRRAANAIMPMGSTVDQIQERSKGVLWPFGNGKKEATMLLLELRKVGRYHGAAVVGAGGILLPRESAYKRKRKRKRKMVLREYPRVEKNRN